MTTETRLTEVDERVLRSADARGYAIFADPEEADAAEELERRGLLGSWRVGGGVRSYEITPAGRALLSKGEG